MERTAEIAAFAESHPQPYRRDEYLGLYQDVHGGPEEPFNHYIQVLARAYGHAHLQDFALRDLTTWKQDISDLTGVSYAGVGD